MQVCGNAVDALAFSSIFQRVTYYRHFTFFSLVLFPLISFYILYILISESEIRKLPFVAHVA